MIGPGLRGGDVNPLHILKIGVCQDSCKGEM